MSVAIELVTADWSGIPRAAWDDLADAVGAPPWSRAGWLEPWWQAFGRGPAVVLLAYRQSNLVGVLPLERRGARLSSMSNWHTPSFALVAADDTAAAALLERASRSAEVLELSFVDGSLRSFALDVNARQTRAVERLLQRSPYLPLALEHDGPRGPRPKQVRRDRAALERLGELRFEIVDGSVELASALAEGFRLEASGWKANSGTAIRSDPDTKRFYERVAAWAARAGILRLVFLCVDERRIAFSFCIEHDRHLYYLKQGYDPEFARFGPGRVALRETVDWATASGCTSFEFLGGEEPYKAAWTDQTRPFYELFFFRRTVRGVGAYASASATSALRAVARRMAPRGSNARRVLDRVRSGF